VRTLRVGLRLHQAGTLDLLWSSGRAPFGRLPSRGPRPQGSGATPPERLAEGPVGTLKAEPCFTLTSPVRPRATWWVLRPLGGLAHLTRSAGLTTPEPSVRPMCADPLRSSQSQLLGASGKDNLPSGRGYTGLAGPLSCLTGPRPARHRARRSQRGPARLTKSMYVPQLLVIERPKFEGVADPRSASMINVALNEGLPRRPLKEGCSAEVRLA
jgi:hypothetical protein